MSVRVIARVRPLLNTELERDVIIQRSDAPEGALVRIPNPRSEHEMYSFQFNSVYGREATQQQIFDDEIQPTVKQLFRGSDVTLFAYGVTGTGKTHTMRGGKSLADRGVIPRLLSALFRRSRKIEKDSAGQTNVEVSMSYYEIYCDRVYDLFESLDKRTPAGLPIRDNGGKTVVVGLTERPCTNLKEFEKLYDEANINRSIGATKLNAQSSRSHAILTVKVTQISADRSLTSTVSAIDLAGSEDNRRTENGKDRMVESAAINKSLFVLAQCVEAIGRKQARIPYRESKMTRILSLGQNNGVTIMILNLAPVKSYHLDTLSSLNFANRTKKIEVNEVENQPVFRGKAEVASFHLNGPSIQRQPLKPKHFSANIIPRDSPGDKIGKSEKPVKSFMVYAEKARTSSLVQQRQPTKRASTDAQENVRPSKMVKTEIRRKPSVPTSHNLTAESIEALIDRKVSERLASATLAATAPPTSTQSLSADVQARLDALEKRVCSQENERSEGLQFLLMAKQHQARGEDMSALRMYQLALPFFPENEKLRKKIASVQSRLTARQAADEMPKTRPAAKPATSWHDDNSFQDEPHQGSDDDEDDSFLPVRRAPKTKRKLHIRSDEGTAEDDTHVPDTPRTKTLLRIINTRDVNQIRLLKGIGTKKADAIITYMCEPDAPEEFGCHEVRDFKGIGTKGLQRIREGIVGAC